MRWESTWSLTPHVVPRARAVRVQSLNEKGQPVTTQVVGWPARIMQHEIDHLRGALYIDKMLPRTFTTGEHYGKQWGRLPVAEVLERLGSK